MGLYSRGLCVPQHWMKLKLNWVSPSHTYKHRHIDTTRSYLLSCVNVCLPIHSHIICTIDLLHINSTLIPFHLALSLTLQAWTLFKNSLISEQNDFSMATEFSVSLHQPYFQKMNQSRHIPSIFCTYI